MGITVPEVLPQPVPEVRDQATATPTTFGGGPGLQRIGDQLQQTTKDAGEIATFEKIRADQTAVEDATAKLSQANSQILYDPNSGVLSSKGLNSIQAHDDGWVAYQKTANDLASKLSGEAQKGAFMKAALTMGDSFNRTAMAHVSTQMEKHDENSFKALTQNLTDQGVMAYGDPLTRDHMLGTLDDNATQYARRNGMDADQATELKNKINSNFHEQTIARMLGDGNDLMARQYYSEKKDDIVNSEIRDKVEKMLGEGSLKGEAARQAGAIFKDNPKSESEALASADKISNPEVQDATRALISRKFQQDRQAAKNDQDQAFLDVGQRIKQSGKTDPVDIAQIITPAEKVSMRDDQYRALLKSGQDNVTSPKVYLDFMDKVKDGTVTKMSRADLEEKYLPFMDAGDKKKIEDMWVTGRKGAGNAKLMDDQNVAKQIDTSLVNSGIIHADSKKRNEDQKKTLYQFDGDVHSDIVSFESANNRSPKPEEIKKIVDDRTRQYFADHMVKVDSNAILPNPQKPVSLMTDSEKGESYVPYSKIPGKDATTLESLMRQGSRPVTKDKTQRAYAAYLAGDRKRLRSIVNE